MVIQSTKDELLCNVTNNQHFLHHLSTDLDKADVLIVKTAIASARSQDVDKDLLVLLLHHTEMDSHELFFAPEHKQSSQKNRIWCIKQTKGQCACGTTDATFNISSCKVPQPSCLLPGDGMERKGEEVGLKPEEWGWRVEDNSYLPTQTDLTAVPSQLLDVVCCICKKDCFSRRCRCRKYVMPCTECHGTSCNLPVPDTTDYRMWTVSNIELFIQDINTVKCNNLVLLQLHFKVA